MSLRTRLDAELDQFKRDGVYKRLNYLASPQDSRVQMEGRGEVVILSSNNYLGLCNVPEVIAAGKRALDRWWAANPPSRTRAAGTRTRGCAPRCSASRIS